MYLLMLVATFVSALYGYNLSVRADYDNVIARRKAIAIVFKMLNQEKHFRTAVAVVKNGNLNNPETLVFVSSGDTVYVGDDGETVVYKDVSDTEHKLCTKTNQDGCVDAGVTDGVKETYVTLVRGRRYFPSDEMVSKVLCTTVPLEDADGADKIKVPQRDENSDGYTEDSASCSDGNYGYLVTYKKLDPRWVNRVTGGPTKDVMDSFVDRKFYDNIGVVVWNTDHWVFRGKINFHPVYAKDEQEWFEMKNNASSGGDNDEEGAEEEVSGGGNNSGNTSEEEFPALLRERTYWELPKVFGRYFFTDKNGDYKAGGDKDFCARGCFFKIKKI